MLPLSAFLLCIYASVLRSIVPEPTREELITALFLSNRFAFSAIKVGLALMLTNVLRLTRSIIGDGMFAEIVDVLFAAINMRW